MVNTSHIKDSLITNFKPVWFISIMSTGISSVILYNFTYEAHWLRILGIIMFSLCSFNLLTSTILFASSLTNTENRRKVLTDLNINVFLGCYAMGFTSWINMVHYLTNGSCPIALYILWWISNIFSLFAAWFIFFRVLTKSAFNLEKMTPTILLPIVSLTVTSASGQVIYSSLPSSLKLSTIITCFFLWANAMGLTFIISTIYIHRLLSHKLPPKLSIFTSFILIGPFGQGSFSIQLFGQNLYDYLKEYPMSDNSDIEAVVVKVFGLLSGLFLQSMGLFFTFLAIASVISYGRHQFHYGMWAMTFPLGTMALATNETFKLTGWTAFRIIATIYAISLLFFTVTCIIGSVWLMTRSLVTEEENESHSAPSIFSGKTIV